VHHLRDGVDQGERYHEPRHQTAAEERADGEPKQQEREDKDRGHVRGSEFRPLAGLQSSRLDRPGLALRASTRPCDHIAR
jgi:hypothetical protein